MESLSVSRAFSASQTVPEQWYTGSLFSPSPAETKAGALAVEPYFQGAVPSGRFDAQGEIRPVTAQRSVSQYTLIKYGLTDRLSIYSLPTFSYGWGKGQSSTGVKFNDLPIELHYNILTARPTRYRPSVTAYLGFIAPTGNYSGLSQSQNGVGQGVWFLRFGFQSQSVYRLMGHAARLRIWAVGRQPLTTAHLHDITSYGTSTGFLGTAHPGTFGNEGASFEYGLTKSWVMSLDLYGTWAGSTELTGKYRKTSQVVHTRSSWSGSYNLGPAMEYNWSPAMGFIGGVIVPFTGHNASRAIMPEVAVNMVF